MPATAKNCKPYELGLRFRGLKSPLSPKPQNLTSKVLKTHPKPLGFRVSVSGLGFRV